MGEVIAVYSDGGCIGPNPSKLGGTWAALHVGQDGEDERVVWARSGILKCATQPHLPLPFSSNHAEFFALARALVGLPEGWSGMVCCDSLVTIRRFFHEGAVNNVPELWIERMRQIVARLGKIEPVLLDGHPSKAMLNVGVGKRGNPVSIWNVLCDRECSFQARMGGAVPWRIRMEESDGNGGVTAEHQRPADVDRGGSDGPGDLAAGDALAHRRGGGSEHGAAPACGAPAGSAVEGESDGRP